MNETTLLSFRTQLEKIRFTLVSEVKNKYKSEKDNLNEQVADIADDAVQSYSRQFITGLGEQEWKKLRSVEEAIKKINDGQYGICSECQEPISEARLKAIPFAAHCVDCLETMEKKNR